MSGVSKRFDGLGEKDRLADGSRLWCEPLLLGLCPEGREIRWDWHAGHNFHVGLLERVDLCREIVGQILITPRISEGEALLLQHRWKAHHGIAPCVSITVVWIQRAHRLIRIKLVPHRVKDADDVFEPPKEVIGIVKRLPTSRIAGIALLTNEPWLPRRNGRDAWHLLGFTGRRDRVCCLGCRGH